MKYNVTAKKSRARHSGAAKKRKRKQKVDWQRLVLNWGAPVLGWVWPLCIAVGMLLFWITAEKSGVLLIIGARWMWMLLTVVWAGYFIRALVKKVEMEPPARILGKPYVAVMLIAIVRMIILDIESSYYSLLSYTSIFVVLGWVLLYDIYVVVGLIILQKYRRKDRKGWKE